MRISDWSSDVCSSDLAASDTMNGAVAGVLIAALTEQFGGRSVSIMLAKVSAQQARIRDSAVSGEGRARIGGEDEWIGFRFSTRYDTAFKTAAYPEITLGGVPGDERNMPDRKSTRLNSSHKCATRMPSSAWKNKKLSR